MAATAAKTNALTVLTPMSPTTSRNIILATSCQIMPSHFSALLLANHVQLASLPGWIGYHMSSALSPLGARLALQCPFPFLRALGHPQLYVTVFGELEDRRNNQ
jgi:hypothetical protein